MSRQSSQGTVTLLVLFPATTGAVVIPAYFCDGTILKIFMFSANVKPFIINLLKFTFFMNNVFYIVLVEKRFESRPFNLLMSSRIHENFA